jgi:predicted MPP superfamily phosphohydrolase
MKNPENVKFIDYSEVEILPLFDWHLGSHECDETMVDSIIEYIKKTDNCYTFLGGDLIECSIYGKMNAVHTQKYQVTEQVELLVKKLKPIQDKILFSVCDFPITNSIFLLEKGTKSAQFPFANNSTSKNPTLYLSSSFPLKRKSLKSILTFFFILLIFVFVFD